MQPYPCIKAFKLKFRTTEHIQQSNKKVLYFSKTYSFKDTFFCVLSLLFWNCNIFKYACITQHKATSQVVTFINVIKIEYTF